MTRNALPTWFDSKGMTAWADGMATALGRRVRIIDRKGTVLVEAGAGSGDSESIPLEVNSVLVGHLDICPAVRGPVREGVVRATETFQALAESRNTVTDLVQTTSRQWRELTVLYRTSDLLRVGQSPAELAAALLEKATRALRGSFGIVRYRLGEAPAASELLGDTACSLAEVAEWAAGLEEPVLASEPAEITRHGFEGGAPTHSFLAVPLRCRGSSIGALVLGRERLLGADDLKLAALLAGLAGQAFENILLLDQLRDAERLRRELEVAAEIQASILPAPYTRWDWLEVAGSCALAEAVGGDAFIVIPEGEDMVLAGVADVCGHGLSSALLTASFVSQVKALALTGPDPASLLEITNDLVVERVGTTGLFITVLLLGLHRDGTMAVVNAGHPSPLVVSPDGAVRPIEGGGVPLGVLAGESFPATRVELPPGDMVVAYSDGLTEASSPDGRMFGEDRLIELLGRLGREVDSAQALHDRILSDLAAFRAGGPQHDDLTLVVTRRTA